MAKLPNPKKDTTPPGDDQADKDKTADVVEGELAALAEAFDETPPQQDTGPEPAKEAAPSIEAEPASVADLAALLQGGSILLAGRYGPRWMMSEEDAEAIAAPLDRVLAKYLPDLDVGPEAALVVAASSWALGAWSLSRQDAAEAPEQGADLIPGSHLETDLGQA